LITYCLPWLAPINSQFLFVVVIPHSHLSLVAIVVSPPHRCCCHRLILPCGLSFFVILVSRCNCHSPRRLPFVVVVISHVIIVSRHCQVLSSSSLIIVISGRCRRHCDPPCCCCCCSCHSGCHRLIVNCRTIVVCHYFSGILSPSSIYRCMDEADLLFGDNF